MGSSINSRILDVNMQTPPPASLDVRTGGVGLPSHRNSHFEFELSFSAKKMLDERNDIPKSTLLLALVDEKSAREFGRTEVFVDSSKLEFFWCKKIQVHYVFGSNQPLIFRVYGVDPKFHGTPHTQLLLHDQALLAESRCFLSQIVTAKKKALTLDLNKEHTKRQIESITVQAEETLASKGICLKIGYLCTSLHKKKEGLSLKISREDANGSYEIATTEVAKNNPNLEWSVCLTMQQIISKDDKLVIEVGNININNNSNRTIGKWQASVSDLEKSSLGKLKVLKYAKSCKGQLSVEKCEKLGFLDYLCDHELGYMVAVDFAATGVCSGGLKSGTSSTHERVLKGVGEAMERLVCNPIFPAWCLSGKTTDGKLSSCFNLNLDNCEVKRVDGVLRAYYDALSKVISDKPASLSEVIKKASHFVAESCKRNDHKYYVLLIITNGDLIKPAETIDALVDASKLPLSILIVGVGDGKSFNKMKKLRADNGHLLVSSRGSKALRDIVSFVPNSELPDDDQCMAEALLKEIPEQFCTYMQIKIKSRQANCHLKMPL